MINPSVCAFVCLSLCVSVCMSASISLELLDRSARNFVCRSLVAVGRSSSSGVALRYVLPVLWMTSRLAVIGATPKGVGSSQRRRPGRSLMSMNACLLSVYDVHEKATGATFCCKLSAACVATGNAANRPKTTMLKW